MMKLTGLTSIYLRSMDLSADSLGVGCQMGEKKAENELFKIGECLLESSSRKSTFFFATRVMFNNTLKSIVIRCILLYLCSRDARAQV